MLNYSLTSGCQGRPGHTPYTRADPATCLGAAGLEVPEPSGHCRLLETSEDILLLMGLSEVLNLDRFSHRPVLLSNKNNRCQFMDSSSHSACVCDLISSGSGGKQSPHIISVTFSHCCYTSFLSVPNVYNGMKTAHLFKTRAKPGLRKEEGGIPHGCFWWSSSWLRDSKCWLQSSQRYCLSSAWREGGETLAYRVCLDEVCVCCYGRQTCVFVRAAPTMNIRSHGVT